MVMMDSEASAALTSLVGSNLYLGLTSTKPNSNGTNITEPTIGVNGYARLIVLPSQWSLSGDRKRITNVVLSFPNTPSGAWGSGAFDYGVWYTAASGGTSLRALKFSSRISIVTGTPVQFAAGELSFELPWDLA